MVMRQAGLSGLVPNEFEVVASIDDIIDQTITDVLSDKLANDPFYLWGPSAQDTSTAKNIKRVQSTLSNIRKAVTTVLNNEGALTVPSPLDSPMALGTPASDKLEFATANTYAQRIADTVRFIVQEIKDRCRDGGLVTYNDMINLVSNALTSTSSESVTLATQLSRQYPVIMIDEFQDTDPMQWAIFKRIFEASNGDTSLVTVGDPKQAIYRFRGADVNVYLSAVEHSSEQYGLGTNYRSDEQLLTALDVLLRNEHFDNKGDVGFVPVKANSKSSPFKHPVEIRYLPGDSEKKISSKEKLDIIATDLVDQIIAMLSGDHITEIVDNVEVDRRVTTSDIAILVRSHHHGALIHKKMVGAGIPAVRLKVGSVFETEAARQMKMLLRALAYSGRAQYVRAFSLSWFGSLNEEKLRQSDVDMLIEMQRECASGADYLQKNGFTAMYLGFRNQSVFLSRLLSTEDGLRHLTDLDHIADILASRPQFSSSVGPLECLEVLEDLIEGAEEESDEQVRRIETDQQAVRIMTIHASKGLQFPIVFLPTLFHPSTRRVSDPMMFPASLSISPNDERVIDLPSAFGTGTAKTPLFPRDWVHVPTDAKGIIEEDIATRDNRKRATQSDIDADNRRLFYVAMTRAQHKIVGYWFPGQATPIDPFINAVAKSLKLSKPPTKTADLAAAFDRLYEESGGNLIGIPLSFDPHDTLKWKADTASNDTKNTNAVSPASFDRSPDDVSVYGFGRWSYSSITRRLKAGSLDKARPVEQESVSGIGDETDVDDQQSAASPFVWSTLPKGAGFGDAVHAVLDNINPAAPDLRDHVYEVVSTTFASWGDDLDRDDLTDALVATLRVPLDRDFAGKSLADLGMNHRLSEMKFDFPLPCDGGVKLAQLVDIVVSDPNISDLAREYFDNLRDSAGAQTEVAGFMNGSIDAVFRIQGDTDRFIVCDYKTNRLHYDTDVNPLLRYDQSSMKQAMLRDGYFFQALIYSVALHRYLKQRITNYDYDTHFGGVAYLFLRGLDGSTDSTGAQHGYYRWMPSKHTIIQLDEIFTEELI
jgi:exodeoxyribonuclease V beta subunit